MGVDFICDNEIMTAEVLLFIRVSDLSYQSLSFEFHLGTVS